MKLDWGSPAWSLMWGIETNGNLTLKELKRDMWETWETSMRHEKDKKVTRNKKANERKERDRREKGDRVKTVTK